MGLDMYLRAHNYIWREKDIKNLKIKGVSIPKGYSVRVLVCEAVQWRKENAIHKWFVDNVQDGNDDCKEYYVSHAQLKNLVELCKYTIKTKHSDNLPPTEGFFFGSTQIDECYWEGLQSTVDQLEKALSAFNEKDWCFYYSSSW